MNFQVAAHQVEGYRVNTPIYEGPLDLLLQLIERAELDITTLALAQVTDQYLAHLKEMQRANAAASSGGNSPVYGDAAASAGSGGTAGGNSAVYGHAAEVSGFLVIAARLLQIKSAALLPRAPVESLEEEEEDPGEALARQLIAYKRFKELSGLLAEREEAGLRAYLRVAPPAVKIEAKLDMSGLTLDDLARVAREIFASKPDLPTLSQVVTMPRVTIREKIRIIVSRLRGMSGLSSISFHNFLKRRGDRLETVVTFLAMLELIKRHVVEAEQPDLFSEIAVKPTGEWDGEEDAQLEFIE